MKKNIKYFSILFILSLVFTVSVISCNKEIANEEELVVQSAVVDVVHIANVQQQMFFTEVELLDAFNNFSGNDNNATSAVVSYDGSNYSLMYIINNGEYGLSYGLAVFDDDLILDFTSNMKTHTCSGDPCNSCDLENSYFEDAHCECLQADCDACKCNHTVTYGHGSHPKAPNAQELVVRLADI